MKASYPVMQSVSWLVLTLVMSVGSVIANEEGGEAVTPDEELEVTGQQEKQISVPSTFGSPQVSSWRVIDNSNIVLELRPSEKYKATFVTPCRGIRFAETIALSTMGPYELDEHTTIFLPDGERCHISRLVPYTREMEQAEQAAREKIRKGE